MYRFRGRWAAGGIEGSGRRPRALPGGLGRSTAPCERGGDYDSHWNLCTQ